MHLKLQLGHAVGRYHTQNTSTQAGVHAAMLRSRACAKGVKTGVRVPDCCQASTFKSPNFNNDTVVHGCRILVCIACRGLAKFSGELPVAKGTIRQIYGAGVRAGMYPLTDRDLYWFICFNADEVRHCCRLEPPALLYVLQQHAAVLLQGLRSL